MRSRVLIRRSYPLEDLRRCRALLFAAAALARRAHAPVARRRIMRAVRAVDAAARRESAPLAWRRTHRPRVRTQARQSHTR
jgi:hypothetical protein